MTMQRRDYLAISKAIRKTRDQTLDELPEDDARMRTLVRRSYQTMTVHMAHGFSHLNPQFNVEAFFFNCLGKIDAERAARQLAEIIAAKNVST